MADGSKFYTLPVNYDQAAAEAPQLGEDGVPRVILRRLPDSRARWEFVAPFEASDNPRWGEE
jgi:hypothetical protein